MDRVEPADDAGELTITLVYCPNPGVADEVMVVLRAGATVAEALGASGLQARHPAIDLAAQPLAIWGRLCALVDPLRDRDRVEVLRPLRVDPKEARRLRQGRQRAAGPGAGKR